MPKFWIVPNTLQQPQFTAIFIWNMMIKPILGTLFSDWDPEIKKSHRWGWTLTQTRPISENATEHGGFFLHADSRESKWKAKGNAQHEGIMRPARF